jgi:pimeloyl-ACP methyl ester carboxylesterase
MNLPAAPPRQLPLRPSDLRGLYRLGVDGSVGLADLVEAMHHTITSRIGFDRALPIGRSSGITGAIYGAVRGSLKGAGHGVDAALRLMERSITAHGPASVERDTFVAALNGLFGDHLERSGNPLAIRMALRSGGMALPMDRVALAQALPAAGRKLLVLVHGLCMNDRQWSRRGHDHGQALAQALGYTPLYLHYNSGRHVSHNGREFAALLQRLLLAWPMPVDELVIVGHSMGGLVARSACHQAKLQGLAWPQALKALVCLGTPHHGAPLERGGRRIDQLFGLSAYAAPFARLGKTRSAGITDLRYGNLQDADWQGRDRHAQERDDRQPTPLPAGAATFLLGATTADKPGPLHHALIGDGLVPLASALGEHREALLALQVPAEHRHVVVGCGHLDLLCHAEVQAQLQRWLAAPAP